MSVAGIRSEMTSVTGRPALIDEPRSPWMMPLSPPPRGRREVQAAAVRDRPRGRIIAVEDAEPAAELMSIADLDLTDRGVDRLGTTAGSVAVLLGERLDAGQGRLWPAGGGAHQQEADDDDAEEQRQQADGAADDELDHGTRMPPQDRQTRRGVDAIGRADDSPAGAAPRAVGGEYSEGGGPGTGPPPSARFLAAPYLESHQSSTFHMSELVPGFLRKLLSLAETPRTSAR
jgi:hypothetical protein